MILKLSGVVEVPEETWWIDGKTLWIGDKSITEEITKCRLGERVVHVSIADEHFTGDLGCLEGEAGWSEWTPGTCDMLHIGGCDLTEVLFRYDGQFITMYVSDEPINTLEDYPEGITK